MEPIGHSWLKIKVWAEVFFYLAENNVLFEGILLKPSMVTQQSHTSTSRGLRSQTSQTKNPTCSSPNHVKFLFPRSSYEDEGVASVQQNKRILESSPPSCVNRCENCMPCEATLVIPSDPKLIDYKDQSLWEVNYSYYPLVWKCKCGDKLYEP
ncbi:putative fructose-bisphosphate aldolase [Helianthus anomalus]